MKLQPVDQLVQSISTYTIRPVWSHVYVAPFVFLYLVWIYIWYSVYGFTEYWELGCIIMAIIGILQVGYLYHDFLIICLQESVGGYRFTAVF